MQLSSRQLLATLALLACGLLAATASLTGAADPLDRLRPPPPTVVFFKEQKWQLKDDYLGGWEFQVIDATNKTTLQLSAWAALPEENPHVPGSYVGYPSESWSRWSAYAFSYFFTLDGKPHFGLRTWWDKRVLIDLEAGKQVPDHPIAQALEAMEKEHVLNHLRAGVGLVAKWSEAPWQRRRPVEAAIHLASRLKLKEAVPLLKQLEAVDHIGSCVSSWGSEYTDLKDGDVDPSCYCIYSTRSLVQFSLRRMGEQPAGLPATCFRYVSKDRDVQKYFEPKVGNAPRHERAARVRKGMRPLEVLTVLGPPDYVEGGQGFGDCVWRYDLDAAEPYTLLVSWNNQPTVHELERVKPALWAGDDLLGPGVTRPVFGADGSILARYAKTLRTDGFKGKIEPVK